MPFAQPSPQPDPVAPEAEFYHRILHRFIELAADLAEDIHDAALTPPEPAAKPARTPSKVDYVRAFNDLGRGVRRYILLAREVATPPKPAPDPARQRIAARQTIIRTVEDTIQREAVDDEADALHTEFLDRLDSRDLDQDIATRPVADIIAEICRDLGLVHALGHYPYKRRTPADLAVLRTRAAATPQPQPTPARRPAPGVTTLRPSPYARASPA